MAKARPEDGYPYQESFVADNDYALGRILEYLSGTKWWKEMAVFITEDDAQGGVDHNDLRRRCEGSLCRFKAGLGRPLPARAGHIRKGPGSAVPPRGIQPVPVESVLDRGIRYGKLGVGQGFPFLVRVKTRTVGVFWRLPVAELPCISKSSGFCNCSEVEDRALPVLRGAWQLQADAGAKRRRLVHVRQLRAPCPARVPPVSLHVQQMRDSGPEHPPALLRPRPVRDSCGKSLLHF